MKLRQKLYIAITTLFALCSCARDNDNYAAPDAEIYGSIIDQVTNEPVPSEQPNGFRIRMISEAYGEPTPIDFWGKADGTFQNKKVFSGKYKVIPIEGAFFPVDTQQVVISGSTELNFKVIPFLSITASATADANTIVTKFTISRSRAGGKIKVCKSLIAPYPTLSNSVFDKAITRDLSGVDDETILSTEFRDTIPDVQPGKTYYVRVTAATENTLNKYNYSTVMKVETP